MGEVMFPVQVVKGCTRTHVKPTPTQAAVLVRMHQIDCAVHRWQAIHGVRGAAYRTIDACLRHGWVEADGGVDRMVRLTVEGMAEAERAMAEDERGEGGNR
ncbi:MAG: hypothetical protein ACYCU7_18765 [Acidimicrobiales bacterium]